MKYIIRSIKYLIYFAIIFFLIVIILCLFMHRDITDFAALFKEGALWQILVMFVAVAAIYPALGYKKNKIVMDGSFKDYRKSIMEVMNNAEYQLADETPTEIVFRHKKTSIRMTRMWEDAITFEIPANDDATEIKVDGPFKDTTKLIGAIVYDYRKNHPREY